MKLSRKKENRERLMRNLATSLILNEQIVTTSAKAKFVLPLATRLLRYSTINNLTSKREAKKILFHYGAQVKLFEDIRTRVLKSNPQENIQTIKLNNRKGDNAPQVKIILNLKSLEETIKDEQKKNEK